MNPTALPDGGARCFITHGERLGRKQRLRRNAEFQQAYARDTRFHAATMVLFLRQEPDASLRLGVVASKRVGDAPERARAKRRLRTVFRTNRFRLATAFDVVLVAKRAILAASFSKVEADFLFLAKKAGILAAETPAP